MSSSQRTEVELRDYFERELGWGSTTTGSITFDFIQRAAAFARGGVVLDAGAGYQRYKPFFADSLYLAMEHETAGVKNKNVVEYDLLTNSNRIPLNDSCVDAIFSTSTVEHLEDIELFFAESARVLKPGGRLFIQVPFAYEEHETPYHFQHLTSFGLFHYYRKNSFEEIVVKPSSSSLYTAKYLTMTAINDDCTDVGKAARNYRRRRSPRKPNLRHRTTLRVKRSLARSLFFVLSRGKDIAPHSGTRVPIGWIAEGKKTGERIENTSPPAKEEFVQRNWCAHGGSFELVGAQVVPTPGIGPARPLFDGVKLGFGVSEKGPKTSPDQTDGGDSPTTG